MSSNSDSDFESRRPPPPPLPDGYRWTRYEMQRTFTTLTIYCREKCIGDIVDVLSDLGDTLKEFKKGCFGQLFKLPNNPIRNNQLIHYVISREVDRVGGDPTELWFRVNNTFMRFSRFEFALVTGLKFGKAKFDPNSSHVIPASSFYTRVLKNKPIIVSQLLERFKNKKLGEETADYLKAAKIIFAYSILFGYDITKTNVAEWMWVLVEDSKGFDSFPWGSYSYQILLHYLSSIKKQPTSAIRQSYHFFGFSTAFLAWIYCAIPKLGDIYGGIISNDKIPRILRFRFIRSNLEVENISGEIYRTLEPTHEEREKSFWKSIEREGDPLKLQFQRYERATKKDKSKTQRGNKKNKTRDEEEEDEEEDNVVRRIEKPTKKSKAKAQRGNKKNKTRDEEEEDEEEDTVVRRIEKPTKKSKAKAQRDEDEVEEEDSVARREQRSKFIHDEHQDEQFEHTYVLPSPQRRTLFQEAVDEVMSRFEPRFNEIQQRQDEMMSQFGGFKEFMHRQDEMMLRFNEFMHRHDNFQSSVRDEDIPDEENNAWISSQAQFASQGQIWGGIGTQPGDSWHSSVWGTQWTDDSRPLWGDSQIHHNTQESQVEQRTPVPNPISSAASIEQFTMPDFRTIRQRRPSRALLSPFDYNDKKGEDYDAFKNLKENAPSRNVGLGYAVGLDYFTEIESMSTELDIHHINAYLAILHSNPAYCDVKYNREEVVLTDANFMHSIGLIWKHLHENDACSTVYDVEIEEVVPQQDLIGLSMYVTGDSPRWGEIKPWYNYTKLVMVCHVPGHWITIQVHFDTCVLTVYDSLKRTWSKTAAAAMKKQLIPLARILPQVLKVSMFYELHKSLNNKHAKYTQWEIKLAGGPKMFKQSDNTSCGLYALKYVESLLSGDISVNMTKDDVEKYRFKIAKTIYTFSTDGGTVPISFDI